ncbi:hypothetical protein I5772_22220 [Klebsiella pneumoniae]|uniref:hypothetical protein n=1 Tax=Klebsiella pneumoniae TaxID=573 RepID=UPI0018CB9401|nr:hypothetical protein [Klebsiella pneumoniae]MBG9433307.1 hypothetical protein [Klebsiella pneumoniae]HDI2366593.1 hypothetical protein [Klebsiella pneumoniae]HDI2417035.1 hypothetical protein [Klebsiella pneumoniae]HDI2428007.1 hypothetical protein [Klebsiella pneumoniae]HDI2751170.1 hypothetical protein [Klebsiella pneumoniae]
MKPVLWIFVLIIAPFVIAKVDQWRKRGIGDTWAWWKSENMPYELRSATLFLSEQDISTTQPVPMHCRVDQVYQTKNGVLIPLDTKLRQVNHIYESDIIQLSVYRVILSHKYKAPVAKYGYVRTVVETADGDRVRYIKTNLLSEKEVVKLWHRYQSIRSGQVKTSCSCGGKFHM